MAGRPVILQAFCLPPHESAEQERQHLLCPVRALKTYLHRSGSCLKSPSLFICFGSWNKGNPVSKQCLAHWVVEAITQAYEARGITLLLGVRAHSTRDVVSSSALARGVPLQEICAAAGWSSPHTFIRFYNLDLDPTPGSQFYSSLPDSYGQSLASSASVVKRPGESVTLSCTVSGFSMGSYYMHWIRQKPGQGLEWIGRIDGGTGTIFAQSLQGQFSITKDTNKNMLYLEVKSLKAEDTAVYYCARSSH
ncbi:hypothetical protein QTP86_013908 [Hemibagrus guttatus]|nr:hypothetical protein QTP86_013908 [Hemibagrus guttatus]